MGNYYEVESDYDGEEPARRCIDDGRVYCSLPPQRRCKRCHQFWMCAEQPPICHDQEGVWEAEQERFAKENPITTVKLEDCSIHTTNESCDLLVDGKECTDG